MWLSKPTGYSANYWQCQQSAITQIASVLTPCWSLQSQLFIPPGTTSTGGQSSTSTSSCTCPCICCDCTFCSCPQTARYVCPDGQHCSGCCGRLRRGTHDRPCHDRRLQRWRKLRGCQAWCHLSGKCITWNNFTSTGLYAMYNFFFSTKRIFSFFATMCMLVSGQ